MACNDLNSHGSPPLTFAEANVNRSPNQGGGSRGAPQQPSATIMKKIEDKILLRKTTLPEM